MIFRCILCNNLINNIINFKSTYYGSRDIVKL